MSNRVDQLFLKTSLVSMAMVPLLWFGLGTASAQPAAASGRAVNSAPGGCGTTINTTEAAKGFVGIRAFAKRGVSASAVLKSVPNITVALWCASQGFVSSTPSIALDLKFQSDASMSDVTRAVTYFWNTKLYSEVLVISSTCLVNGKFSCPLLP
jgi:hypothetical protein